MFSVFGYTILLGQGFFLLLIHDVTDMQSELKFQLISVYGFWIIAKLFRLLTSLLSRLKPILGKSILNAPATNSKPPIHCSLWRN